MKGTLKHTYNGDAAGTTAWPRKCMFLKSGARLILTAWRQVSKYCMSLYSLLQSTRLMACIMGLHVLTVWRLLRLVIRTGNIIGKEIYRTPKIWNWIIYTALYRRRVVGPSLQSRIENMKNIYKYWI